MSLPIILGLGQTALELALFNALTVLALFLSYSMLNVCDLSTDGCFTLGAAVGAVVAIVGHPWLSIPAAMGAGMLSGLVTAFVRSITAISAIILLVTPSYLLITVQINEFAEKGAYSIACAFATILILITYGSVLLMNFIIKHFGTSRTIKEAE